MDLNINFLKTFMTLAQIGSFTKTAQTLHMTQPGVSQHIMKLEECLGRPLLIRHGKSFELTEVGQRLLNYGESLFQDYKVFLNSLGDNEPHSGKCFFASPGSFGMKMYSFLLSLNKKYPGLEIHYHYMPNQTIEREILGGNLDAAFMSVKPVDRQLQYTAIDRERLLLAAPKKFRFEGLASLNKLGLINHPDASNMATELFAANFKKTFKGFKSLKVSGGNNQIGRILEPVALGRGYTVLPEYACKAFHDQRKIKYIKLDKEITNHIYFVKKKHRELPSRYSFILEQFSLKASCHKNQA